MSTSKIFFQAYCKVNGIDQSKAAKIIDHCSYKKIMSSCKQGVSEWRCACGRIKMSM
jgi:hypothetical protein